MKTCIFRRAFVVLGLAFILTPAKAQNAPVTGHDQAAKYFQRPAGTQEIPREHFLALGIGRFMSTEDWEWGDHGRQTDSGGGNLSITYRVKEWTNSMDLGLRVDFSEFDVDDQKPLKMSIMPALIFPEASSHFPIYFGAGAGLGVFFKQVQSKSPLAFDYQLFAGARFFDVLDGVGFFIETGMKNFLLLTTQGQFNGVYLNGGATFTF